MNSWPLFDNMFLNHCLSLIINLAWARCCMANIIFRCGISILTTDISSHFSSRSITSSIATPVPPTVWTAAVCLSDLFCQGSLELWRVRDWNQVGPTRVVSCSQVDWLIYGWCLIYWRVALLVAWLNDWLVVGLKN